MGPGGGREDKGSSWRHNKGSTHHPAEPPHPHTHLEVVFFQGFQLSAQPSLTSGFIQDAVLTSLHPSWGEITEVRTLVLLQPPREASITTPGT